MGIDWRWVQAIAAMGVSVLGYLAFVMWMMGVVSFKC